MQTLLTIWHWLCAHEIVWWIIGSAIINLPGIYDSKPIECTRAIESVTGKWWSRDGNFDVEALGLVERSGRIVFSSVNKNEVELWLSGARAVMKLLRAWALV
jgi:hypothetical protein